jgi:competence protein ComEC
LLAIAAWTLQGLWWLLDQLAQWPFASWQQGAAPLWALFCAVLGIGWLLLPKGVPARWVGSIWLLPLVFAQPASIAGGEARFTLLDVGQGLAAVVQTQEHVLVFDTGPGFASGFNTGEAVVAPYLRRRGIAHIDTLVISHGDNDHIGGLGGLLEQVPVERLLSSVAEKTGFPGAEFCYAGQSWVWDEVLFEILNPPLAGSGGVTSGNNASCVLRIEAGQQRLLLSGDIEQEAEQYLLRTSADKLAVDILVVPHHGSATSSSTAFLEAVSPRLALFPVGYRNRYGFPKPQVVARYRQQGVLMLDTAYHGALEVELGGGDPVSEITRHRQTDIRYWRHQPVPPDEIPLEDASSGSPVSLLQ